MLKCGFLWDFYESLQEKKMMDFVYYEKICVSASVWIPWNTEEKLKIFQDDNREKFFSTTER